MKIIKNLSKIVIVGGGSAGWMTAAMLIKFFPSWDISVIESPTVPTVGVGESTLLSIKNYCHFLEINEQDFMSQTDAIYKMSIKFTDFYEKDSGGFHYPFGEPYLHGSKQGIEDWFFKKVWHPYLKNEDFARYYYPNAALYEQNKFSENRHKNFEDFNPTRHVAYHFDATKFGAWLRENYCKPRGVKHIPSTVINTVVNEQGIEYLILEDQSKISSDLFVDCTGWRSILLSKALNEEFISYTDMLPNNRAWATRLPYKNVEKEMEPFTNCTAISNGWVWNIPVWSRIGTGYVYSDKFVTPDQAKEEFKQHLMSNKMICPRSREEVDMLEFKDIPMRVGIHRRTFVKNVVAIGLSAGFIEPLESNGLFSVHVFLEKLVKTLLSGSISQYDIDVYNTATRHVFDNFAEFVALHYAFSKRNDSEYWKANNSRIYDEGMPDLKPSLSVGFAHYAENKMFRANLEYDKGLVWIATGMNHHIIDKVNVRQVEFNNPNIKNEFNPYFLHMELARQKWLQFADKEPTIYQYLKNTVHKASNLHN